ncbi:hypothetical protein NL676_010407 [Syzygium grande]|nr:hypothetical protein NL676_010407 [Syzygium grande]
MTIHLEPPPRPPPPGSSYSTRPSKFAGKNPPMAEKSKVPVIGCAGYLGKFIVEASANSGHPTFPLARESHSLRSHHGRHRRRWHVKTPRCNLLKIGRQCVDENSVDSGLLLLCPVDDVVISAVGTEQLEDRGKIVAATEAAGNVEVMLF